jgi:hypothetical protein
LVEPEPDGGTFFLTGLPDFVAPAEVTDVYAEPGTSTAIPVMWTSAGDDGNSGTAESYDLRISQSPIIEANFASATGVEAPSPGAAGSGQSHQVAGLAPCTTYYLAVKTRDEAGLLSPISNVVSAGTACGGGPPKTGEQTLPTVLELTSTGSNPAATSVAFEIGIPIHQTGSYQLEIFDVSGRSIRVLGHAHATPGRRSEVWDLRDHRGALVGSGIYFARLSLAGSEVVHRVAVVR